MITSSSLKEEGYVGVGFFSVASHKSCCLLNKNVVWARPLRTSGKGDHPRSSYEANTRRRQGAESLVRSPLRDCAQSSK